MQIKCLLTCKVAHCFSHHDGKVVHGWSLAPNRHDQFTCLHLLHVRCCSRIPGVTETAGGCFTKVDPWARVGLVVVWWAGSSHRGAGKLCKLRPLRREASFVTMAQSIWPTAEIARKVFSHLLSIYTVYWQTKFSLFDSSVFQCQESRMNFISCLKSVSMRIEVGTLPWLMTEDRDIPILRMAMVYTAHEEPLLRTQARNAMLTLFSKIKIGEGQLLRTALEMAKSRKLGWVIGKSWHCTWHVMPLYWTRWLGKASCWRIYALSRLSRCRIFLGWLSVMSDDGKWHVASGMWQVACGKFFNLATVPLSWRPEDLLFFIGGFTQDCLNQFWKPFSDSDLPGS